MTISEFVNEISLVQDNNQLFENPYAELNKKENLCCYLTYLYNLKQGVDIMLIGEAPGHRGCAITGIPFTDEIQLLNPDNKFALGEGYSVNGNTKENSATVIWEALREKQIVPLMWNAFPFHPYNEGKINSNRTPCKAEIEQGKKYIDMLINIFKISPSQIYAIGKTPLSQLGLDQNHYIRHPSYGGKKDCQLGILKIEKINRLICV